MRTYVLVIVSAFALPTSALSQAVEFGPSGVNAYSYHRHYECRSDCIAAGVPPQGRARQARPRPLAQISRSLPKALLSGAKLMSLPTAIPMEVSDGVAQKKRPRQTLSARSSGKNRIWIDSDITAGIVWASPHVDEIVGDHTEPDPNAS
jgi:hypothetical protein